MQRIQTARVCVCVSVCVLVNVRVRMRAHVRSAALYIQVGNNVSTPRHTTLYSVCLPRSQRTPLPYAPTITVRAVLQCTNGALLQGTDLFQRCRRLRRTDEQGSMTVGNNHYDGRCLRRRDNGSILKWKLHCG